jgi:Predicted Fe-S protein
MRKNRSSTPCIGICSTTFGDDVCKGCKRFSHEITNWGKFSTDERAVVNSRLEQFKTTILEEKFTISDNELFESKMNEFSINFNSSLEPITWIFDLLRASSNKDLNVNDFGIEILPAFSDLSLLELRDLINQEMLQLSEAHYYKFFNRAT